MQAAIRVGQHVQHHAVRNASDPLKGHQPVGGYEHGFRVPLLVVSAFTPQGYISNNYHSFGSILRFIEQNFGLTDGMLDFDDARAKTDLTEFFNMGATPRPFTSLPAIKKAGFFINDKRPLRGVDADDR